MGGSFVREAISLTLGTNRGKALDYLETFAATPNAASIPLLLATVVEEGLPLSH